MKLPENDSSTIKDQKMKVDEAANEETKNEPAFGQILSQQNKEKKNLFNGGVYTNDEVTVKQYFGYYAKLANQQNMLQDTVRTELYRNAILNNPSNFAGKVVMDVGCGSGILSLFAAQAGAKKVYAVEASSMADHARKLVKANGFEATV